MNTVAGDTVFFLSSNNTNGNTKLFKNLFIPLKHLSTGFPIMRIVARYGLPYLFRRKIGRGIEKSDDEIELPLCGRNFRGRHTLIVIHPLCEMNDFISDVMDSKGSFSSTSV